MPFTKLQFWTYWKTEEDRTLQESWHQCALIGYTGIASYVHPTLCNNLMLLKGPNLFIARENLSYKHFKINTKIMDNDVAMLNSIRSMPLRATHQFVLEWKYGNIEHVDHMWLPKEKTKLVTDIISKIVMCIWTEVQPWCQFRTLILPQIRVIQKISNIKSNLGDYSHPSKICSMEFK